MEYVLTLLILFSVVLLLHSYFFYPVVLYFLTTLYKKNYSTTSVGLPNLSIIISAYNEENVIEKTIRNFMQSEYDLSKIEIIIGSDLSTDNTNQIVEKLKIEFPNIMFLPFATRRGKANVLNDLVKEAKGEILVFSDANTMYEKNAIKELVKYYADKRIGGVCGKLILLDVEKAKKEGSQEKEYWEYESWIKNMEGKLGILIGANGGIYSIRRELYINIPSEFPVMDDFYVGLKILEQHKDMIYAKEAIATEYVAPSVEWEFKRKVRTISINLDSVRYVKSLLLPKYGLISFAFWSHKIFRWLTPLLMIVAFISNSFLLDLAVFRYLFAAQITFYVFSLIGYFLSLRKISIKLFSFCYYFTVTNIALLAGIYKFFTKKQTAAWQSTERV
jgi:cellulose synthase/poly-beta-1,6-N-acetylglucosamine synthase-like glycosyltransferase